MSDSDFEEATNASLQNVEITNDFNDSLIVCIDCRQEFVWTAGEQAFYFDKNLLNPPKRCKECKNAKNHRLAAIEIGRLTGKRQRIEVKADCARCLQTTTVPFYPCQGRPVYCRACFIEMNSEIANGANGTS